MHWLRAKGAGPIELETYGDSQDAFQIYQGLGFELTEHFVEYRRFLNLICIGYKVTWNYRTITG